MQNNPRKFLAAWLLIISLLLPALSRAETGVQTWVQRFHMPGNYSDEAVAVAVDRSNHVVLTGCSYGGASASYDYTTIRYSGTGVPLWTNFYNGPANGEDYAWALAVDGNNNIIVTGQSEGIGTWPDYDYATIKYSSEGVPLWTNRYSGPANGDNDARAVAVDDNNDVIVTGVSQGSGGLYDKDYATIKYSSTGEPLWTNRYNGPGNQMDCAMALAVDASNSVIVTGFSARTSVSPYNYDYATIKYSSAGEPLWTNRYNGPGNGADYAWAVTVDHSGNVIVTGHSDSTNTHPYNYDYATIKYSSGGVPLWTNRYNGLGNYDDEACAVAVDGSDNVIVTGFSARTNVYPYKCDYVTIKYASGGLPLWTNRYHGPGDFDDLGAALAVDGSGNVVVTGQSVGSGGAYDYATIKYSSDGLPLWTNRYSGPGNANDCPKALALDHSGNPIVTGYSTRSGGGYEFATVKYIGVPEPIVSGLPQSNGRFKLRVDEVLQPGTLVIEASTDLAGWNAIFTNTAPTNAVFYTDPDASKAPRRLYRAYQFP